MNTPRIILFGTLCLAVCLTFGARAARAEKEPVATLVDNLKSPDESVRVQAINEFGDQAREGRRGRRSADGVAQRTLGERAGPRRRGAGADRHGGQAGRPRPGGTLEGLRRDGPRARREGGDGHSPRTGGHGAAVRQADGRFRSGRADARLERDFRGRPAGGAGLIAALDNEKAAYWACLVLRDMGPAAKEAVPALAAKLNDPQLDVRREAILALGAMEDAATPAVEPIAAALGNEHTATAATYALGRIGQIPKQAEAVVRANVSSGDKVLSAEPLGPGPRSSGRQGTSPRGHATVDLAVEEPGRRRARGGGPRPGRLAARPGNHRPDLGKGHARRG